MAIDFGGIAPQISQIHELAVRPNGIGTLGQALLGDGFGFIEPVEVEVGVRKVLVGEDAVGVGFHFVEGGSQLLVELAERPIKESEVVQGNGIARIGSAPPLIGFDGFVEVTGGIEVVAVDVKALDFAGAFLKVKGFFQGGPGGFVHSFVALCDAHLRPGESEVGINFNGFLEEGNGVVVVELGVVGVTGAVGL